jgi:hypothetical protein
MIAQKEVTVANIKSSALIVTAIIAGNIAVLFLLSIVYLVL